MIKITLTTPDDVVYRLRQSTACTDSICAECKCPSCGFDRVCGRDKRIEDHDTYRSDALCAACGTYRGVLRVKVSTLFGLEEDERVLNGRCRVY